MSRAHDGRCVQRRALLPLIGLLPLWLAGCATPTPDLALGPWTTGRLSVRIAATREQPVSNLSAAFELRGDGERGELRLSTPLGTLMASARWAPGQAVLTTSNGETWFANLDDLSREALGEAMPLRALPAWLAGQPWPDAPSQAAADGFEQLGWRVGLARRAEGAIDLARDAAPAVAIKLRLDRTP